MKLCTSERILLIKFSNAKDSQRVVEAAKEAIRLVRTVNQQRSVRELLWIELFCILFSAVGHPLTTWKGLSQQYFFVNTELSMNNTGLIERRD
jgi:hypothetical protein